ncbi:putative oxysterol binding protein (Orp8) [Aspergillus lucknowensis]|uniref:Oxysterol-binding protein-like protein 1 n=1 Tax=Aspergillus lucknowensis TaxID=176173 RepID=A0ABR4LEF3_9EURO
MSSSSTPDFTENSADESSKLKTFVSILRKFVGVSDIASVRFSLPAQLLEPTPNLEYWNYLDRPETFASIGKSEDPLGRMLEVLRFWFTKDLKYIKGRPCKPYNSTLGEFFRCSWEVDYTLPKPPLLANGQAANGVSSVSVKEDAGKSATVCFLTEQTSHHPPVSAFYIDCPETGVSARGFDQISAKFTGTSIRVAPGQHNLGIFLNISERDDEEYQLTHPAAHLGGLLRGALSITVADSCYIVCSKTGIKVILQYLEEGWISRAQNRIEGVIFRYNPGKDTITRIKDVPEADVLARISGSWHAQLYYTLAGTTEPQLLIDIAPLFPVVKRLPPEEAQLSNESRKFWSGVTEAILERKFSQATKLKQEIEERQREKAAERQANNQMWKPRFFTDAVTPLGKPTLSEEGVKVLEGLRDGKYTLKESEIKGA